MNAVAPTMLSSSKVPQPEFACWWPSTPSAARSAAYSPRLSPFMIRCCQSMFTLTLSRPCARSLWITCSVMPMLRMRIFIAGSAGDERPHARRDRGDLADEVAREVDDVRPEVADRARAGLRAIEPPDALVRLPAPRLEVARAEVDDVAELAAVDELPCEPNGRHEPVVEATHVLDLRPLGLAPHLVRHRGAHPERLLAQDVLAGAGGGDRRLGVHDVRAAVVEEADPLVGDLLPPVRRRLGPAPAGACVLDGRSRAAGDGDELRPQRDVEVTQREERARVRLPHEGVSEHANADRVVIHTRPAAARPRRATASTVTASSRIAPSTISFTSGPWPIRSSPFATLPITSAPRSADHTLPRPPNRLVPPMTAAAIASSVTCPGLIARLAAASRPVWMRPGIAARKPESAKTAIRISRTLMPARRAASALPPTAKMYRPNLVRVVSQAKKITSPSRITPAVGIPAV